MHRVSPHSGSRCLPPYRIPYMDGGVIAVRNTPLSGSVTKLHNVTLDPSCLSVRGLTFPTHTGQSKSKLSSEFADIRNRFKGRYIRLYGACDRPNY